MAVKGSKVVELLLSMKNVMLMIDVRTILVFCQEVALIKALCMNE